MNLSDLIRKLECGPIDLCTAQAAAKALVDLGAERDRHAAHSEEYFQKLQGWIKGEREQRDRAEKAERERDEAKEKIACLEPQLNILSRTGKNWMDRAEQAEARLAEYERWKGHAWKVEHALCFGDVYRPTHGWDRRSWTIYANELIAALTAAHAAGVEAEREECAKVARSRLGGNVHDWNRACASIAAAIINRSGPTTAETEEGK